MKPPLATVGFYSSLSGVHVSAKDKSLAALRAKSRVRVGLGLEIEVDQDSLHDGGPWSHLSAYNQTLWVICCVKDHLRDTAKKVTAIVKGAKSGPAKWSRVAYRIHVRLFDGAGTDDDVRAAKRARRAVVRRLTALGYRVVERDDRGGKIVHAPTKKWSHAKGCDR